MEANVFIHYLPWLREPQYVKDAEGLSADYSSDEARRTTSVLREHSLYLDHAPQAIQDLFARNDLSQIRMLWTSFLPEPTQVTQGWHFAQMSEAMVVMFSQNGRMGAYNEHPIRAIHGESQLLGVLAKDMESYLEALLCGAMNVIHFSPRFSDDPQVRAKLEPIAQLCPAIAGGDEYHPFWSGVLGL